MRGEEDGRGRDNEKEGESEDGMIRKIIFWPSGKDRLDQEIDMKIREDKIK